MHCRAAVYFRQTWVKARRKSPVHLNLVSLNPQSAKLLLQPPNQKRLLLLHPLLMTKESLRNQQRSLPRNPKSQKKAQRRERKRPRKIRMLLREPPVPISSMLQREETTTPKRDQLFLCWRRANKLVLTGSF